MVVILAVALVGTAPRALWAGQPLETETARLLGRRHFDGEAGVERQASSSGTEFAVPFALAYGLANHTELLVEPVFYVAVRDKGLAGQSGLGDIETTITQRVWAESSVRPAIAVAGEVKVPTASNRRIGSGKADVTGYVVGSKQWGRWDTHANLGYTVVGHPQGVPVNNTFGFAVAEEYRLNGAITFLGEVFGSTAARSEQADGGTMNGESALTPEIGGAEIVGALGIRYHAPRGLTYSLGVSVDNRGAVLIHPGIARAW